MGRLFCEYFGTAFYSCAVGKTLFMCTNVIDEPALKITFQQNQLSAGKWPDPSEGVIR